ncbi:unnamed protein product, partial [Ixodes hexagonus]
GAVIKSLVVTPCTSDPCVVPVGTRINITFEVVSNQDSETVQFDPRVTVWGLQLPIPGVEKDACQSGAVVCPVHRGKLFTGTILAYVYNFIPSLTVTTTWKVLGAKGIIACGATNVTVVRK